MGDSILRKLPWGPVGMIGLMLGVERCVAHAGMGFQDSSDWAWRSVARSASRDARRYDVLCFGDSQVKLGVVPRAIRDRSGLRAYNLANSGGTAAASYFVLRRALDSGARPAAVVVNFFPTLLRSGPRDHVAGWSALLDPAQAARLGYWARDPDLVARVLTGWLLPTVRCRDAVRANLLAALAGKADSRLYSNYMFFRNWTKNDGAHLFPIDPTLNDLTDAQIDFKRQGFFARLDCHPTNAVAIDRFLELAAAHDLPVYWVLPPLLPRIHEAAARSGFEARHEAFVRARQARHANLIVLDGRGKMTDVRGFYDAIHLSHEGAYGFSLALGDVLRKTVSRGGGKPAGPASRWIALAACRPVPLPDGLENVHQSELALNTRAAAVR